MLAVSRLLASTGRLTAPSSAVERSRESNAPSAQTETPDASTVILLEGRKQGAQPFV